jgi:hypothetical protein
MCEIDLSEVSLNDIMKELSKRNLLTNTKSNNVILNDNIDNVKLILTMGIPQENLECRECLQLLPSTQFTFYQGRVDKNGYLMRSNALCVECSKKINNGRTQVFKNSKEIPKPKKGDVCQKCERSWSGNWHKHHVDDVVIGYICGHCNMSLSDQRNKQNNDLEYSVIVEKN